MSTPEIDATTAFARTLVDEWARAGVAHACVSPGSRSTPLALALADDARIRVHVHLDERSASYFAVGIGRATGRPAVVLCTSGSAAANLHPAVVESHHGRVPLLVATADRPPELRDTGAGQTIDQVGLFGAALRWSCDPGPPAAGPGVGAYWRSVASRAVAASVGPPAGPVHLNLPFREPLVPTGAPLVEAPGRDGGRPWHDVRPAPAVLPPAAVAELAAECARAARGAVVAGPGARVDGAVVERFAAAAGWPVLADPLSGARRGANAVAAYEALLRVPDFAAFARPDLVLRLGGPPTSKLLTAFLDPGIRQVVVDPDAAWLDPNRAAAAVVRADATALLDALATAAPATARVGDVWLDRWLAADRTARAATDRLLDGWDAPFEGRVLRDVAAALPDGATLAVASSMPVRDLEWFMAPRTGLRVVANRGTNGIDGFVSTVLGVAAARGAGDGPVVGVLGDLCLLHDANGLIGASGRGIDAVLVVLDNRGGGIFSFLPQAGLPEHFELLFGTPHDVDLLALGALHGVHGERVERASDLVGALGAAIGAGGVHMLVVPTDRADNVARHHEVWAAVAAALRSPGPQGPQGSQGA